MKASAALRVTDASRPPTGTQGPALRARTRGGSSAEEGPLYSHRFINMVGTGRRGGTAQQGCAEGAVTSRVMVCAFINVCLSFLVCRHFT